MSWEGFTQNFCERGHFFVGDAIEEYEDSHRVCDCGAAIALSNVVDDTNGEQEGVIPPFELEKLLLEPEERQYCNLGHEHVTKRAVYRVITREELWLIQHWWDADRQEHRRF